MVLTISEEQYKQWNDAISCASFGDCRPLKHYKELYPDLYRHMTSMLNKRTKISKTLQAYMSVCPFVYWGDLTFNEEEDVKDLGTKRKQVQRYLDKFFKLYLYVEEEGSENERWHIHYLGILRDGISFNDLYNGWHSISHCECIYKYYEVKKKIKYITKYCVKQVPRVHMSKRSIQLLKDYKKSKMWHNLGFEGLSKEYWMQITDLMDLPF